MSSSAACAAIHAKMPVVTGQVKSAPCSRASFARISLIVISRPLGICFMIASTSIGAGMTILPVPQRLDILPVTGPTLGRPLLSASFSRQDFRVRIATSYEATGVRAFRHELPVSLSLFQLRLLLLARRAARILAVRRIHVMCRVSAHARWAAFWQAGGICDARFPGG